MKKTDGNGVHLHLKMLFLSFFVLFTFLSSFYQNIFDPLPVLIGETSGPSLIDLVVAEQ